MPHEVVVDAADDLQHVLFAFAQVVVFDAVELGSELVALLFQRPFGVDFLFFQYYRYISFFCPLSKMKSKLIFQETPSYLQVMIFLFPFPSLLQDE